MDLAKLVCMLHSRSLHFTRLDCFDDRFEGALPRRYVEGVRKAREAHKEKHPELWETFKKFGQVKRSATEEYQEIRARTVVNCWHQNAHESAAMWSQYLKSSDGVTIQSTYKRLVDAIGERDDTLQVRVGIVKYIDYDNDLFEHFNNLHLPATHKRASFHHEQELRAVAYGSIRHDGVLSADMRKFPEEGIDVPVALADLVESIYIAPGAPAWFKFSVEAVVEKYGLSVSIKQSSLDDDPLW